MFTACKFHEIHPRVVSDFILITKNSFTVEQVLSMEVQILRTVEFNLHTVLPCTLLDSYCIAVGATEATTALSYANYLIDLSSLQVEFCRFDLQTVVVVVLEMCLTQ